MITDILRNDCTEAPLLIILQEDFGINAKAFILSNAVMHAILCGNCQIRAESTRYKLSPCSQVSTLVSGFLA